MFIHKFSVANFIFGIDFIYEEKVALHYTDVFINCSVEPIGAYTSWNFENIRISDFNNKNKYSQNISGLTIYNVTEEDQGNYICFLHTADSLNATIQLSVICKLLNIKSKCICIIRYHILRATRVIFATKQDSSSQCYGRSKTELYYISITRSIVPLVISRLLLILFQHQ